MQKEFHIKAKKYSNVFVDQSKDLDNDEFEIYLALHIPQASCSVRLTPNQARSLMEALQEALAVEEKVA